MPQPSHDDATAALTGPGFELHTGPAGGMRLRVGTNALARAHCGERDWSPQVAQQGPGVVRIEAGPACARHGQNL